jgi:hypothetical protein
VVDAKELQGQKVVDAKELQGQKVVDAKELQYITGQICPVSTAPVRFRGKGWGSRLYQRKEKTLCS